MLIGGLVSATVKLDKMSGGTRCFIRFFAFRRFSDAGNTIYRRKNSFPLVWFALPVLLALFLQAMYGAVDLWVVGRFGSAADVSAVSTGSQIMQTVTVVVTGLAMGITILIGQKIGERKPQEAGSVVMGGVVLFAAIAVFLTVLMQLGAVPLARLMHAPPQAFDLTVSYVRICSAGAVFIVAYNLVGSIFRGIGDSKMPLITVSIA